MSQYTNPSQGGGYYYHHNNHHSNNNNAAVTAGPRAKCDQVIYEALCKACEVIVGSRTTVETSSSSSSSSSSSRFNLQIPEINGVRQILSSYRTQLHVPVRLDVYYEHPPNGDAQQQQQQVRRELLERWCLEYTPGHSEQFMQNECIVTNDPMVQLTHVCKRIVVWLRTLYCWTRLLPAIVAKQQHHHLPNGSIGFSIYVVPPTTSTTTTTTISSNTKNADADILELIHAGFVHQSNTSTGSSVTTPYGQLSWQVLYCPQSKLETILPSLITRKPSVRIQIPTTTSRPIPMPQHRPSTDDTHHKMMAAHSAPTTREQPRPFTYTERSQQKYHQANNNNALGGIGGGKSYDPSRMLLPPQRGVTHKDHGHNRELLRRNTSTPKHSPPRIASPNVNGDPPPERVMSGLSLALMMATTDNQNTNHPTNGAPAPEEEEEDEGVVVDNEDSDEYISTNHRDKNHISMKSTTRRAALHQMPPHLLEGEYGYGYNNHIPWQKIHPSNTNPVQQQSSQPQLYHNASFGRTLSSSPNSVQSTGIPQTPPAGAAFLGTTPPVLNNNNNVNFLIPPMRSRSKSITPPFQPRPAGFLHEANPLTLEPQELQPPPNHHHVSFAADNNVNHQKPKNTATTSRTQTSLDILRSSPFQQHSQKHMSLPTDERASMLSSLSFTPGSDISNLASMLTNSADLRKSLWNSSSTGLLAASSDAAYQPQQSDDYYSYYYTEEMPFAVDLPPPPPPNSSSSPTSGKAANSLLSGSSLLGQSAALASLAQKCAAPNQRLKLFESEQQSDTNGTLDNTDNLDDLVGDLANQLDEFRAFGASLHGSLLEKPNEKSTDNPMRGSSSSSSTPIPLRS